jgi:rubrerythrin
MDTEIKEYLKKLIEKQTEEIKKYIDEEIEKEFLKGNTVEKPRISKEVSELFERLKDWELNDLLALYINLLDLIELKITASGATSLESKDSTALFIAGNSFYSKGYYSEALPYLQKSAGMGDADAQYLLGLMYLRGLEVKKDIETAIEWLKKSAEQKHKVATKKLNELTKNTATCPVCNTLVPGYKDFCPKCGMMCGANTRKYPEKYKGTHFY